MKMMDKQTRWGENRAKAPKKIGAMILAIVMVLSLSMTTMVAAATSTVPNVDKSQMTVSAISAVGQVTLNDVPLNGSDNMGHFWVDANGRTQAPVRLLVEAMGYTISYNKGVVTVPGGPNGDLVITIGKPEISVGDSTVKMDTIGATIDGRTYIPLRYVAEALGATVEAKGSATGLIIKIATTFTPEKTINGVLDISTTKLVKTNAVLDKYDNTDAAYVGRDMAGVIEFNTKGDYDVGLDLTIRRGNGWDVSGLDFGDGAKSQYEVVYALIDDVVEETSRQQIKDMLQERNSILSDGYDPNIGVTQAAINWKNGKENTTTRIGNVNFTWGNNCKSFTLSTASN